ncbi:MAG: hypothetical protein ACPL7I_00930, partial [Myxococcota bacterium]
MNRISKMLIVIGILLVPTFLIAENRCIPSDSNYYESCMIDSIAGMVSEKKYNYAIELLSTYEEWFRSQNKNDSKSMAKIFSSKAAIYYLKGEYEESLKLYKAAEHIYNSISDKVMSSEMKSNIAVVLASMNNYSEALKVIGEAEGFYRNGKYNIDLADLLYNKGIIYFFQNDYDRRYVAFSEAEKLYLKEN